MRTLLPSTLHGEKHVKGSRPAPREKQVDGDSSLLADLSAKKVAFAISFGVVGSHGGPAALRSVTVEENQGALRHHQDVLGAVGVRF